MRVEENVLLLLCSWNSSFISQKTFIHQKKKNIKKYSKVREEKKNARRRKNFYLYCVIETVHQSTKKHSFIRETKIIKKYSDFGEEE